MKVVAVLYLLTAAAVQVYALPGGAPSQACATITPVEHTNPANSAPQSMNPFSLYLNAFACPNGTAGYCYYPGATYQLTLSSSNNVQYRGLLVQGRQSVTMSPVGSFSSFTSTTRQSSCIPPTPPESAVTHNSRVDKTCEVLMWTAPPNGTGPVFFQWAVVVRYSPGSVNMFYAPLQTMMITEIDTQVMGEAPTCATLPPPTAATTAGATSLSGIGFWAILATAIVTAAKMVA